MPASSILGRILARLDATRLAPSRQPRERLTVLVAEHLASAAEYFSTSDAAFLRQT